MGLALPNNIAYLCQRVAAWNLVPKASIGCDDRGTNHLSVAAGFANADVLGLLAIYSAGHGDVEYPASVAGCLFGHTVANSGVTEKCRICRGAMAAGGLACQGAVELGTC